MKRNHREVKKYFKQYRLRHSDDLQGRLADLYKVIELDPGFAEAYYQRGVMRLYMSNHDGALEDFAQAIRYAPNMTEAYRQRARIRYQDGDVAGSLQDADEVIRCESRNEHNYFFRASVYMANENFEAALADCNMALQLTVVDRFRTANALCTRGAVRQTLGDLAGAIQDFSRAIGLDEYQISAYFNRATAHYAQKNIDAAFQDFATAVELDPKFAEVYFERGKVYVEIERWEKALADFTTVIRLDPFDSIRNIGKEKQRFFEQKNLDTVLTNFSQAMTFLPTSLTSAYFYRGLVREKLGDLMEATQDYSHAIQLDPKNISALNNRAILRFLEDDFDNALADLEVIIQTDPDYANGYNNRGIVHLLHNEYELALADFQKARDLNPSLPNPLSSLALTYQRMGNFAEAQNLWRQLIALDSNYSRVDWIRDNRGWPKILKAEAEKLLVSLKDEYS